MGPVRGGGWTTLSAPEEYGGQGLPQLLATAVSEYLLSANQAFEMYHGLTAGRDRVDPDQGFGGAEAAPICPNMIAGKWTGHDEPDRAALRHRSRPAQDRAEPQADGSYKISRHQDLHLVGEHDLAENIIHLVLAEDRGAPDTVKGISLFIVPKFMVNEDGSLGARNGVTAARSSTRWAFTAIRPAS
jgi:alkylation response protein AidB-like acyl-CoA dehydrogenase